MYRIGIVGAASLLGKELSDVLQESLLATADFVLFDEEDAAGQMTAAGDELAVVQRIEAGSFDKMDFVFFVGEAGVTREHWQKARQAGASVIDLTYALEREREVLVRSPLAWSAMETEGAATGLAQRPDLRTPAVVAAHPAAVMLAMVALRLQETLPLVSVAATVMEPASEHGRLAMDEMHQQTVNLLSFQTLPKEQYDAQVAFNLLPGLGDGAKVNLAETAGRIRSHYAALGGAVLPKLALQVVQAPVFHGYTASVLVEFGRGVTLEQVEDAVSFEQIDVVTGEAEPPSNVSAAGQEDVMVRVSRDESDGESSTRFWLWLAADNMKLSALNAIWCALELRKLRPSGKVQ